MASKQNLALQNAAKAKKNEFYTQLTDIEKELYRYKDQFVGKTIFCNCDDPEWSNFWKYFALNFEAFKLKKLISTHFDSKEPTYKLEMIAQGKVIQTPLSQNGDFRSAECLEILKEADIVSTNPPFSLFREYLAQLIEYDKKFIIIGNVNAISYKEVFPLLAKNKIWLGQSIHSGDREFRVPNDYPLEAAGWRIDAEGNKYIRVKGVRWFTNIDYKSRHEEMVLFRNYRNHENDYPKYDNFNAIDVGKTTDIPDDYFGMMGVPITFFDKFDPDQFEIVGNSAQLAGPIIIDGVEKKNPQRFYISGKRLYDRLVIKRKQNGNQTA